MPLGTSFIARRSVADFTTGAATLVAEFQASNNSPSSPSIEIVGLFGVSMRSPAPAPIYTITTAFAESAGPLTNRTTVSDCVVSMIPRDIPVFFTYS